MAWANQRLFAELATRPDEALTAFIENPEWTVSRLCEHIVGGADWYAYGLGIRDWSDFARPSTMQEVNELAVKLAEVDGLLLAQAHRTGTVTYHNGTEMKTWKVETILMQTIHHATEHRAQISAALEARSFEPINLDDIDLWSFEAFEKSNTQ
jgi:uncharacterized damage-inducible protein DinB